MNAPFADPRVNGLHRNGHVALPALDEPDAGQRLESPPAANGRDARGRFTKGNPGGPGNPFARRVASLRRALVETVTEEHLRRIADMLLEKALAGDLAAVKLLLAYVVGRPADPVDPDTLDLQEWQQFRKSPASADAVSEAADGLPHALACTLARAAQEALGLTFAGQLTDGLTADLPAPAAVPEAPENGAEPIPPFADGNGARPGPADPRPGGAAKNGRRISRVKKGPGRPAARKMKAAPGPDGTAALSLTGNRSSVAISESAATPAAGVAYFPGKNHP